MLLLLRIISSSGDCLRGAGLLLREFYLVKLVFCMQENDKWHKKDQKSGLKYEVCTCLSRLREHNLPNRWLCFVTQHTLVSFNLNSY